MAVAITATVQNVYPPRVAVAVTGLTLGDQLQILREVAGKRVEVRGGLDPSVTDTGYATIDAEVPFGVPVKYIALVNDSAEYATGSATYALPGGKVVLSDAITGLAAEVVVMAADDLVRSRDSARFRVGGRTLVVSGPFGQREGGYELFLENLVARSNLLTLLEQATDGVVQIRRSVSEERVDAYLAVDRFTERRWSQDGSDERMLVTIEFAETQPWADVLTSREFTYAEVEAYYEGLTYADAAGDFATYLDAVKGDFS